MSGIKEQVRVNVKTAVNASKIRKEVRNGREKIVIPSATLPDGVVMNGIKYLKEEIDKGYASLNLSPAPLGHPTLNGAFLSAKDPEGLAMGWIGAHNENVRRAEGKVLLDKVIDVERANESEGGRRVLKAIEEGLPIHTSNALMCTLEASNTDDCEFVARNMKFDHDAILLDEAGAATPQQGVGMLLNKAIGADGANINVINSTLEEIDRELDWAMDNIVRAHEKSLRAPIIERMKAAMLSLLEGETRSTSTNGKGKPVDEKQMNELSGKLDALAEAQTNSAAALAAALTEAMTNALKPMVSGFEAMNAKAAEDEKAKKAKEAAELEGLQADIVKANLMDQEGAEELTLNAARKLAANIKAKPAAQMNRAPITGGKTSGFKLPEGE